MEEELDKGEVGGEDGGGEVDGGEYMEEEGVGGREGEGEGKVEEGAGEGEEEGKPFLFLRDLCDPLAPFLPKSLLCPSSLHRPRRHPPPPPPLPLHRPLPPRHRQIDLVRLALFALLRPPSLHIPQLAKIIDK